ncbi:hypothetical protein BDW69DRAFT_2192 [Aspergillus filifer]
MHRWISEYLLHHLLNGLLLLSLLGYSAFENFLIHDLMSKLSETSPQPSTLVHQPKPKSKTASWKN